MFKAFITILSISTFCFGMERSRSAFDQKRADQAQLRLNANLMRAVRSGDLNQAAFLLYNNANMFAEDSAHMTAFRLAYELGNENMILLFYKSLMPSKPLPMDLARLIRLYIEGDVSRAITIKDAIDNTKNYINKVLGALIRQLIRKKFGQIAINEELIEECEIINSVEYIKDLISIGADVNAVSNNRYKSTSITKAATRGNIATVRELIKAGVNVDMQTASGCTALMCASNFIDNIGIQLIESLVAAGANPLLKSDRGYTARDVISERLDMAIMRNDLVKLEIVKTMIKMLENAEKAHAARLGFTANPLL